MSSAGRSRDDRNYYQAKLWEEPETEEKQPKRDIPEDEPSPAQEPDTTAHVIPPELVEEGTQRLLETAKEVCPHYPPSARGPYKVSFYGYTSLKSTIRQQKSGVAIRVSHLLLDAPKEVLAGVLHTLLSRFHSKPAPKKLCQPYEEFCRRKEVEERARRLRQRCGTKVIVGTKGRVRDLDESFDRVNQLYFGGRMRKPKLTWSPGISRRRMGYYDSEHHLIVVSSGLDNKRVPVYVLDYIMYHEMLHLICPVESRGRRRAIHTKEFSELEKRYRDYERALRWIRKYWR